MFVVDDRITSGTPQKCFVCSSQPPLPTDLGRYAGLRAGRSTPRKLGAGEGFSGGGGGGRGAAVCGGGGGIMTLEDTAAPPTTNGVIWPFRRATAAVL